ncbi:hypothetical protein, partial [Bradyrhizobium sp. I1.7.5]|uniref:hypothetical protein n=1 Tax=Bradyrhizobium sp. I1.7.5 TaxID=3156363 RepID=UPI003394D846
MEGSLAKKTKTARGQQRHLARSQAYERCKLRLTMARQSSYSCFSRIPSSEDRPLLPSVLPRSGFVQ